MPSPFLDTNILVYAFSSDQRSGLANAILRTPFIIGVQTLNELANVLRRREEKPWAEIAKNSRALRELAEMVVDTHVEDHARSIALAERYRLSIYDALMLAIALRANCTAFYSEDLHHSLVIEDRLTVLNPFR